MSKHPATSREPLSSGGSTPRRAEPVFGATGLSLASAEAGFRVLVQNSPDVIMTLDRDGIIRFVNHTLPEYDIENVVGTHVRDYVNPAELDEYLAALGDVLEGHGARTLELSAVGPTWWLTRLLPVETGGGGGIVENVLVIATEITERKRTEEALRASENKFRALAETTTAAIFIFRGERNLYANPAAERLTGYSLSEISKMQFWEVIHPEYRELVRERGFARQKGEAVPSRWEVKLLTRSGEERWVDYAGTLFEFGGENAVLGTAVDVTDRKRAEEERRQIEKQMQHAQKLESLGILAGGIAHDFNNLLTGILGSASVAAQKLPQGSAAERQIDRILVAAERAADLTSQMLAYAGKGRFVMERVDLNDVVREVVPLLKTSISKKASLELLFARPLPPVEVDRTQLHQVVMNLITNASEALGEDHGVITLRTGTLDHAPRGAPLAPPAADDGSYVFLEVEDDGCGMDEATKARIFDPFFTTKFTGRGLGLAAVAGIVRAHRGAVRVRSEPDEGTSFRVLLPAASGEPTELVEPPRPIGDATAARRTGTVLVVDDEESVRAVARTALEDAGHRVRAARDGRSAIRIFDEHADTIDVVLLDMSMPHLSGAETLAALRRRRPTVAVVLSSGYSEQEVEKRFAGQGLAGVLHKPFRAETLVERIREAFEFASLR